MVKKRKEKKERERKVILGGVEGAELRMLRKREIKKKQEKELYERKHPIETKAEKAVERVTKKIGKALKKKVISRRILKKDKMSVHIPEFKAPSILGEPNQFFKNEWEETKRSMFL